ncbi:zinc finger protein [Macleaya cordata]|uniref:Zinc finger protein n=1 Tax=Macleaya cordata TaxID=56857 RepID=A0A200QS47_MACCD|nr:zinc finger protein [Macleaya cordata]OVA13252.1 zinc finger protein [Macleaya cordata]
MGGCSNASTKSYTVCELCEEESHNSNQCPWVYSSCKFTSCEGIRLLSTAQTGPNMGKKYLKCQFSTCPSFQWLDEAKGEAKGFGGSSSNPDSTRTGCFACGLNDHWVNECPWKESPCPRPNCAGTRTVRTSTTDTSAGRKFLTCPICNKFHWLSNWIEKVESNKSTEKSKRNDGTLSLQLQAALEAFCKEFMKKNAM